MKSLRETLIVGYIWPSDDIFITSAEFHPQTDAEANSCGNNFRLKVQLDAISGVFSCLASARRKRKKWQNRIISKQEMKLLN